MTLAGFKIQNHPQQVAKRGAKDTVDERITPHELFMGFDAEFRFTLDVAATEANAKCEAFYDKEADGLKQPWACERVWCNPPYSNIEPWVEKAWSEFGAADKTVMLLPANRTEQKWWQKHIEPFRDKQGALNTRFLRGRINFGVPGNEGGRWRSSAPFGCVLVIWGLR